MLFALVLCIPMVCAAASTCVCVCVADESLAFGIRVAPRPGTAEFMREKSSTNTGGPSSFWSLKLIWILSRAIAGRRSFARRYARKRVYASFGSPQHDNTRYSWKAREGEKKKSKLTIEKSRSRSPFRVVRAVNFRRKIHNRRLGGARTWSSRWSVCRSYGTVPARMFVLRIIQS